MNWFKLITTNRETETLDAIETWIVEWTKRYGPFSCDTKQAFQCFTDKESANKFANSLRQAFELIGNTAECQVKVYRQESGL